MKTFTVTASSFTAILGLMQLCPAPPPILDVVILGALSGEVGAITGSAASGKFSRGEDLSAASNNIKRSDDPFEDLPQPGGMQCKDQLKGVTVNFTPQGEGSFRIDNVPSACMTLSNVFFGEEYENQPRPTPLGSAALEYTGVSNDDMEKLQNTLNSAN